MPYVARRIGQAASFCIAFTATFLLLQALPGDAILIKFENPELGLTPEQIAAIRASYGADVPLWQQYLHTLAGFLARRLRLLDPVRHARHELIGEALPATRARRPRVPPGRAHRRRSRLRLDAHAVRLAAGGAAGAPGVFVSVPVFWLGILLIQVFSFGLGWVPDRRRRPRAGADPPGDHARRADLGAARADPRAEHRRGALPPFVTSSGPRAPAPPGCCGLESPGTRSCRR